MTYNVPQLIWPLDFQIDFNDIIVSENISLSEQTLLHYNHIDLYTLDIKDINTLYNKHLLTGLYPDLGYFSYSLNTESVFANSPGFYHGLFTRGSIPEPTGIIIFIIMFILFTLKR